MIENAMKNVKFYWLENCSTCKKAKSFIERHGIREFDLLDIKENPLIRQDIENLAKILGGADELFSRRAIKYRELKLSKRQLSEAEMFEFMTEEYTFLKRPILVIGNNAIAGFFERFWTEFLEENYYK